MSRPDETDLLSTRGFYSGVHLWPQIPTGINPNGWLRNFRTEEDREIALELLDSFVHLPRSQVLRLVESAFHNLSYLIERQRSTAPFDGSTWKQFRESVLLSYPQDALSDPASSGRTFIRQGRANLVVSETQLIDPNDLPTLLIEADELRDVVFVDDFAGTGDQFIEAMELKFPVGTSAEASFEDLMTLGRVGQVFYTPAVATEAAIDNIQGRLPDVWVRPAHILTPRYSAKHPQTLLVSDATRDRLDEFLRRYTVRAGHAESYRFGHGGSGLSISFDHGVPDNTLPIFWSEGLSWTPLRKRAQN